MGHAHRISSGAAARLGSGTTLASRGWRSRVALASLLRELRVVGDRGIAVSGTIAGAGWMARLRRFLRRLGLTMGGRRERAEALLTRTTAPWRAVGSDIGNATLPRLQLAAQEPRRYAAQVAQRAEAEMGDVDTLLSLLGDIGPEELEVALRVVRRVRALAGAA